MQCPKCGAQVNGKFCEYCGSELPKNQPNTINSNNSHTTVINNYYRTETPPYHNIQNQPYQNRTYNIPSYQDEFYDEASEKSKISALLLAVFLGYFGAHQFYAGKTTMGILYIFTMGLWGIGWIVDIVRIASGSFKDADGLLIK